MDSHNLIKIYRGDVYYEKSILSNDGYWNLG